MKFSAGVLCTLAGIYAKLLDEYESDLIVKTTFINALEQLDATRSKLFHRIRAAINWSSINTPKLIINVYCQLDMLSGILTFSAKNFTLLRSAAGTQLNCLK